MGYKRAGWYAYDWIDNDRIPSAERIVPELQHLEVGDEMLTGPEAGSTRFVLRIRARLDFAVPRVLLYYPIFEPGDFVMMRKMLLGIKERAERGSFRAGTFVMRRYIARAAGFGYSGGEPG